MKHGINKDKSDTKWKTPLIDSAITVGVFAAATGVCYLLDYFRLSDLNFLIIYVLGILVTAIFNSLHLLCKFRSLCEAY